MRLGIYVGAGAAFLAVLAGCHGPLEPAQDDAALLRTDKPSYEAVVRGWRNASDSFWVVTFSVKLTYSNRTNAPLYISYCQGPNPPRLERLVHGDWEVAYQPPHLLCLGFHRIGPGKELAYEFNIQGHDPRIDAEPRWIPTDLDGQYRVVWWPVQSDPDVFSEGIPLKHRVSNTFQVIGALP
jgi:hypothetical protein